MDSRRNGIVSRWRIGLWSVLAGAALAGCNPIYYSPTTHNVPLLEGRGEFFAGGSADGRRAEGQGAYALTDNFAIQVGGGVFNPDDLDNGDGGSGHYFEGGLGYFAPLSPGFRWEVFGLIATGTFENHFPSTVDDFPDTTGGLEGNLFRVGIQPAVGYRSRYFEVAASTRLAALSYSRITGSLVYEEKDQGMLLRQEHSYRLIEPALTVRAGIERVKLQVQAGGSINVTDREFRQDDSMITVGAVVRLH